MKNKFIRKIDELGRIVIPKEIRSTLGLDTGDDIEISVSDGTVNLKRVDFGDEDAEK